MVLENGIRLPNKDAIPIQAAMDILLLSGERHFSTVEKIITARVLSLLFSGFASAFGIVHLRWDLEIAVNMRLCTVLLSRMLTYEFSHIC